MITRFIYLYLCFFYLNSYLLCGKESTNQYAYNEQGTLAHLIKPDGVITTRLYSSAGLLEDYYASDNSFNYHYCYDDQDNLVKIEDKVHQIATRRMFDTFGNLVAEYLGNGLKIENTYDAIGRRLRLTLPDTSYVTYDYEAANLKSISRFNSTGTLLYTHTYSEYDQKGHILEMVLIGAAGSASLRYDMKQYCRSIQTALWSQEIPDQGWTPSGNITIIRGEDHAGEWSSEFTYDEEKRLTSEAGFFTNHYAYDSSSNRIQKNNKIYTVNDSDLVEDVSSNYDLNGNLIAKCIEGQQTLYRYDALDRLVTVEQPGIAQITFTYDALYRRLEKETSSWNPTTQKWDISGRQLYLYDGEREIGAVNEEGQITELRLLGIGSMGSGQRAEIGAAIAFEINGFVYAPVHDHRGNVCCLIDAITGETAESYRYSAFGEKSILSATGMPLSHSKVGNPWMFSSKRDDMELGLVFFGKRYYDPEMGRWLTKDPIGAIDGPNRYAYLHQSPLNSIDLYGFFSWASVWEVATSWASSAIAYVQDLKTQLSYTEHMEEEWSDLAHETISKGFLQFSGFYEHPIESGRSSTGEEVNDKVRVTFVNGILNIKPDLEHTLEYISSTHGDTVVHYAFRPTGGWSRDMINAILSKFGYSAPAAPLLAEKWRELIAEMGGVDGGGTIIHYSHSIGFADTNAAKNLLTPEEQRMIHVVTIGSPTMIPNDSGFGKIVNYASKRDGVSLFDPIGYIHGLMDTHYNVELVGSYWGIPFIDHTLFTDTYMGVIRDLGNEFTITFAN
ncbi:MAG: RHS repeat-associated core domain-containing protein [Parachlamydiaceae bacterium]